MKTYKCFCDYWKDANGTTIDFNSDPKFVSEMAWDACAASMKEEVESLKQKLELAEDVIDLVNMNDAREEILKAIAAYDQHNSKKI